MNTKAPDTGFERSAMAAHLTRMVSNIAPETFGRFNQVITNGGRLTAAWSELNMGDVAGVLSAVRSRLKRESSPTFSSSAARNLASLGSSSSAASGVRCNSSSTRSMPVAAFCATAPTAAWARSARGSRNALGSAGSDSRR
jgi:hypothetical protein